MQMGGFLGTHDGEKKARPMEAVVGRLRGDHARTHASTHAQESIPGIATYSLSACLSCAPNDKPVSQHEKEDSWHSSVADLPYPPAAGLKDAPPVPRRRCGFHSP
jgi:hypothetical protein